jgi:PAS domain S-box-containing protein
MSDGASLFRALFETAPDAMIVVDGGGRITLSNPQAERLFGYTAAELLGSPIEMLMPEGARHAHRAHVGHYAAQPRVRPMGAGQELIGRRRDASQFPVEIALSPIDADGTRHFVASIRDISETQRARQALARARYDTFVAQVGQLALESAGDAATMERLPALVATALDVPAVALAFAESGRGALRVRAAVGLDPELLDLEPWRLADADPVSQALARGQPVELEALADASTWVPALTLDEVGFRSALLVPLLDLGHPMGAIVVLSAEPRRFDRDAVHFLQTVANLLASVVQRSHTQDQLAHSQRLDAIGQLTGGVAHDFNNLLTVVSGNLQLLELELADRPEAQELIASALRGVARGAELTRKLLTVARRQRLSPRAIDARALLEELAALLRRTLGEGIVVEIQCEPTLDPVYADAGQLDAALMNLALNARDAMPRGGRLTISVQAYEARNGDDAPAGLKAGRYLRFTVADTGMGMPPEVLTRAFEPFFTTKDSGKGSGLGLSMVYGFVRQSGGQLEVDSRLGYGTRIDLYLPAADAPAADIEAQGASRARRETVLVVEDEAEVRGIALAFLRSLGYAGARGAGRAGGARAAAHASRASDLVLRRRARQRHERDRARARGATMRPGLPVLLTSGYERDAEAGGRAGAVRAAAQALPPRGAGARAARRARAHRSG